MRTLHYHITKNDAPEKGAQLWKEVRAIQVFWNQMYTWSSERLDFGRPGYKETAWASGFTKVGDDDWNAYLVVAFLRFVSEMLPDTRIHLSDEGDYVLAGDVVFGHGQVALDEYRIARHRGYLEARGNAAYLEELEAACDRARGLVPSFFAVVYAEAYQEVPEIAAIARNHPELDVPKMTLDELAPYLHLRPNSEIPAAA